MKTMKNTVLVVLAGGKGLRFKGKVPKQYITITGSDPLYIHSIRPFLKVCPLTSIVIVCPHTYVDSTRKQVKNLLKTPVSTVVVAGGEQRIDSLFSAIRHLVETENTAEVVIVHDAVRPLIHPDDISGLIAHFETNFFDAALIIKPLSESLYRLKGESISCVNREEYGLGESPDIFKYSLLVSMYEKWSHRTREFHDSLNVMELISMSKKNRIGGYLGKYPNLKLTFPHDKHIIKRYTIGNGS